MFPDDKTAEKWFTDVRWPEGVHCLICGLTNIQTRAKYKTMPFRCRVKGCGKKFSAKTEIVMKNSNLGYQIWTIATYLLTTSPQSVSSMKLHMGFGVKQKTARTLAHKISKLVEEDQKFSGVVEVDETYVGGLEKNKHCDKKLNAGRGAVGKKAVAGIKDREINQITVIVIGDTNLEKQHSFINYNVEDNTAVCADDFKSYQCMNRDDRQIVKYSVGQYVDEEIHINGVESFWSVPMKAHCTRSAISNWIGM